jgi:hypothetical protein
MQLDNNNNANSLYSNVESSVIVGSSFNSIELIRSILILGLGKFPSLIG